MRHLGSEISVFGAVLGGNAHIGNVDLVPTPADTHHDVVWLDVSMNEALGMEVLEAAKELVGEHQDCLEGESVPAKAEEVVQSGAEEIKDHRSVFVLCSVPLDSWDASPTGESFVDVDFALEQMKFHGVMFKLNCHFFARILIQSFGNNRNVSLEGQNMHVRMCLDLFYRDRPLHSRRYQSSAQGGIYCPHGDPTLYY